MSPLIADLLARRGVTDTETFLHPDYVRDTHDPFLMEGMDRAVARIFAAMRAGERIAIYADFDCDGVPGASLLSDVFEKMGYANVEVYIPHRDVEGYGVHREALAKLAARKVALIITVDVGTTAVEPVAYAKELEMDVIVTDHHEIPGAMPECVAVLNPKIAPYPFPHLCGTGVAYKLAQALMRYGRQEGLALLKEIPEGWEKWLLDLVAIATVADMVPLVGENRALVHFGLQVLRKSPRPGIRALVSHLRLRQAELTEEDIGFAFAPRINAASRMDSPELALRLLTTKDPEEAMRLATQLDELNASRKGIVSGIVKQVRKRVAGRFGPDDTVVCLGDPEWKPALLGLAANSIMNDRGGVVCLWGKDAMGRLKGSCRSDGDISVVDLFTTAAHALEEFGGHAASGGFSVSHEAVHTLGEELALAAAVIAQKNTEPLKAKPYETGDFDALVSIPEIGWPFYQDLTSIAPFGTGNPKPVFRISQASVVGVKRFGKEKNHVEVSLSCKRTGVSMRGFQFFKGPDDFTTSPQVGSVADVLVTIERDAYRGARSLALRLVDIRLPS